MFESMKQERNDQLLRGQGTKAQEGEQLGNIIAGFGETIQQGMNAYAQTKWNSIKYDIEQEALSGINQQSLNVDNENASKDYATWVNDMIDSRLSEQNALVRTYGKNQKQDLVDKYRAQFDNQFVLEIDKKNKLTWEENWDKIISTWNSTGDLSTYDSDGIYRLEFTNGIVTKQKVELDNPFEETDDRYGDFNHLLNVLYKETCTVMDTSSAKSYVNSQIDTIEAKCIKEDIIKDVYSAIENKETEEEAYEGISYKYNAGNEKPYTKKDITFTDSQAYKTEVQAVISELYGAIKEKNWNSLRTDADGFFAQSIETRTPLTSDILFQYLADKNMVKLNEKGEVVSWYGLSDDAYIKLKNIGRNNDRVAVIDKIQSNPVYWGDDGILDITDYPVECRLMVLSDSYAYQTIDDVLMDQSSAEGYLQAQRNEEIKKALYGSGTYLEDFSGTASLQDLIDINHRYKNGDKDIMEKYVSSMGELSETEKEYLDERLEAQYKINEDKIDELCATYYKEAGFSSKEAMRKAMESGWTFEDLVATTNLKNEVERATNKYVSDLETISVIASGGYIIDANYSYEGSGAGIASQILGTSNKNIKKTVSALLDNLSGDIKKQYGLDQIDLDNILTDEEKAEIGKDKEGDEYNFAVNSAENAYLVTLLSMLTSGDAETISSYYNASSAASVEGDLRLAWKDFERETKADGRYDADKITVPSWSDITSSTNENITNSVSKYGRFKVETSASGVFSGYINRILAGDSPEFIKQEAMTDPLLSEADTDKLLATSNTEFFKAFAGDSLATTAVNQFISKFDNVITQSYAWDAVFDTLASAYADGKMNDLPRLIQQTESAFCMAYGERLAEDMFQYDGDSTVYGYPSFAKNNGKESDATKKKLNEYASAFWTDKFMPAGINSLVNDYLNDPDTSIALVSAEIDKIAGNEENMDRYCIVLALDALGEPVQEYNLDYNSDTFWTDINKYFGRLSKNDSGYDAMYADHVLRVAGSMKASLTMYDKSSIDSIGNVENYDFANNKFTTTSMKESAVSEGTYISKSSTGSPILNIPTGDGKTFDQLDLSFTTEEGRKELQKKIISEITESKRNNQLYNTVSSMYTNMFLKDNPDRDTWGYMLDDACQAIAELSPTYKEYMINCKKALEYMDLPDYVGKAWFENGQIQFEFVDGDISEKAKETTSSYKVFQDLEASMKNYKPSMNNVGVADSDTREGNKAIVDMIHGFQTPKVNQNANASQKKQSELQRFYNDELKPLMKQNAEKMGDKEYDLSASGISNFLSDLIKME